MKSTRHKAVAIVQARMGSTRLPGKVLRPLCGRPMLARVIERLQMSTMLRQVVVATTCLPQDNAVAELAKVEGVGVFRGEEADVLGRYVGAAQVFHAETVVRVTADCPLIDAGVLDQVVDRYWADADNLDYVSNIIERTYPRGLDVELIPTHVLEHLNRISTSAVEREHVTLKLLRQRERYRIAQVCNASDYSYHYWTVDSEQDLQLVEEIYKILYPSQPHFGWLDVLEVFQVRPELFEINRVQATENDPKMRAMDKGVA